MKEFCAQTGGRYTYVDDIANLQDLALAFTSIFDDCDNFIISGCKVSGTSISEGYVYINGKIRRFSGASGITAWPQYIYESNKTETVAYASGADKVGRNVYGCAIAKDVPTFTDPLTNAAPMFIVIPNSGGMTIKDAFFGKYALLLESAVGEQVVKDIVRFTKNISVNNTLTINGRALVQSGNAKCEISHVAGGLAIRSTTSIGKVYTFKIDDTEGFQFFVGDTLLFTISDSRIGTQLSITMKECIAGNISVKTNEIYDKGTLSNTGSVRINMIGYNGGNSYYRDTIIGDGKGTAILSITGSTKDVRLNGLLDINSPDKTSVRLKKNKIIEWRNDGETQIAHIGYFADSNLSIANIIAGINIAGVGFVNIAPAIKENGVLLSDRYAKKDSGLSQFVNTNNTQTILCNQIGAATKQEVTALSNQMNNLYAKKAKLLSDMAITPTDKKTIRDNINAEEKGVCQPKVNDSGWLSPVDCGSVLVRQLDSVVHIHGLLRVSKNDIGKTVFTLPDSIGVLDDMCHIYSMDNSGEATAIFALTGRSRTCVLVTMTAPTYLSYDFGITINYLS